MLAYTFVKIYGQRWVWHHSVMKHLNTLVFQRVHLQNTLNKQEKKLNVLEKSAIVLVLVLILIFA